MQATLMKTYAVEFMQCGPGAVAVSLKTVSDKRGCIRSDWV
ncbi:hypothetical protein BH24ACT16_BH24ACT16_18190 [soil metagenome]|jgi:hypothetical protein